MFEQYYSRIIYIVRKFLFKLFKLFSLVTGMYSEKDISQSFLSQCYSCLTKVSDSLAGNLDIRVTWISFGNAEGARKRDESFARKCSDKDKIGSCGFTSLMGKPYSSQMHSSHHIKRL